jgi:ATP-grasp domain-containing protein/L-aminoacid ligase-like protein
MKRVLILATTTGYQTRMFGEAAERLGVELVFATDRCDRLDDPWRDGAVAVRFHDEDAAVRAIEDAARLLPIDGILPLGDRPTPIAARAAQALGLPGNPAAAAAISRNKALMRQTLRRHGLPAPWFVTLASGQDVSTVASQIEFPCVVKALTLSGSRGVIRADDVRSLRDAVDRIRALLGSPDVQVMRDPATDQLLIEGFVPGREYALEGLMDRGTLRTLAIFDKPDPLDGPLFEETIYVTETRPSPASPYTEIDAAIRGAVAAMGLRHGPVHAECRVNESGVVVLEVAARPIGGLCARALRFVPRSGGEGEPFPLEELLLRHAVGDPTEIYVREPLASGVMMIPIPRRGIYRGVEGIEDARGVADVVDVRITAKADQRLVPLPEGASYLGFIFARAPSAARVERALRAAHARLTFAVDRDLLAT